MKLLILGAGGHGQVCKEIAAENNMFDTINFIDDNNVSIDVIGNFEDFLKYRIGKDYDCYFIGIGNPAIRKKLINFCNLSNYKFTNLISKHSYISKSCKLGTGILVSHGVIVNSNTCIGDNVIIGIGALVDHNSKISNDVYIKAGNVVEAYSKIMD